MDRFKKISYYIRLMIMCAGLLLPGCSPSSEAEEILLSSSQQEADSSKEAEKTDSGEESGQGDTETVLYVYVCGAVQCPGVYEMTPGARIYEAIEKAGGLTEKAAGEAVNQAQVLQDGEQVYIPTKDETAQVGEPSKNGSLQEEQKKVNLNTASKEELMTLTGIGESKADSIVAYREENGGFQSTEELMQISGIKEGVYNKIKDNITV